MFRPCSRVLSNGLTDFELEGWVVGVKEVETHAHPPTQKKDVGLPIISDGASTMYQIFTHTLEIEYLSNKENPLAVRIQKHEINSD